MEPKTLPRLLQTLVEEHGDTPVQYFRLGESPFTKRTYSELHEEVQRFAAGLHSIGVKRGDHVGLISENRPEWLISDLAIQCLGAADVPRGNDSMAQELAYILGFSECGVVLVENATQLEKIAGVRSEIKSLKQFIVMDPGFDPGSASSMDLRGVKVQTFAEVLSAGDAFRAKEPGFVDGEIAKVTGQDIATIIFTSGTTGEPKGVVLTQWNFVYQVERIPEIVRIAPGDRWLSVLPVWHSFERILQYVALGTASAIAYSKPVGKVMVADFAEIKPQWMASVPRVWEVLSSGVVKNVKSHGGIKLAMFKFFLAVGGAHKRLSDLIRGLVPDFRPRVRILDAIIAFIPGLLLLPLKLLGSLLVFSKIKAMLGGKFIAGVSGGGALPPAVDAFFGAAGILLLEGYGLTETAPLVAVRNQRRPVPGTVGEVVKGTECEIRAEDGTVLPAGEMGTVFVRGPQVMQGYYNRPDFTKAVLSEDGWLNTGDLGMLSHRGELKLTGRVKDTIVLLGGENIEPLPIEQKITESEYIQAAVVVGQDQKFLGALIVPAQEAIEAYAAENHVPYNEYTDLVNNDAILELLNAEIDVRVNAKTGFRAFERIFRIAVTPKVFEVGEELSAKQEAKRHVIAEMYKEQIAALFA